MLSPFTVPPFPLPVPSATRKYNTHPQRSKIMSRLRRAFSLNENLKANPKQRTHSATTLPQSEQEKFSLLHSSNVVAPQRCETPFAFAFSSPNGPPPLLLPGDSCAVGEKMLLETMPGFHGQNAFIMENGSLSAKARPAPEILTHTTLVCHRGSFASSNNDCQSSVRPSPSGPVGRLNEFLYASVPTTSTETSFARLKYSHMPEYDDQEETDDQQPSLALPTCRSSSPSDYYISPAWRNLNIPTKSILKSKHEIDVKDQDSDHDYGISLPPSPTSDNDEKSASSSTKSSRRSQNKRCCFCESVLVTRTFAAVEYDRRGFDSEIDSEVDNDDNPDLIRQLGRPPTGTCIYKALWRINRTRSKNKQTRTTESKGLARSGSQGFTQLEAAQIKHELNYFKRYEMAVHEQSRKFTHFFPT